MITTNSNVEESPRRYMCSCRDRVREAMGQLPHQCDAIGSRPQPETHLEGGSVFVQLNVHSDHLMADA